MRLLKEFTVLKRLYNSSKQTAFAIVEFLQKSVSDGSIREDDKEGLETASASPSLSLWSHPLCLNWSGHSPMHRRSLFNRFERFETAINLLAQACFPQANRRSIQQD